MWEHLEAERPQRKCICTRQVNSIAVCDNASEATGQARPNITNHPNPDGPNAVVDADYELNEGHIGRVEVGRGQNLLKLDLQEIRFDLVEV